MQLHELKSQFKKKNKKRVGRGGKRGTTSGKGQKGQKSRSGHRIKPAEREMIQRLPKLRGLKNKSLQKKPIIIKIEDLNKKIEGGIINREVLIKAGLMKKSDKKISSPKKDYEYYNPNDVLNQPLNDSLVIHQRLREKKNLNLKNLTR